MPEITSHPPGTFCWADLATTDADAAKTFYTGLFGWGAVDVPTDDGNVYTMLTKGDKNVCGLYAMSPEMSGQGIPPYWQSYVAVEDVDAAAAKAAELGGTLIMPPFDVMDMGRMAIVQDSTGAAFALWQAKKPSGVGVHREANTVCWTELYTRDTAAAATFYEGLFGWTVKQTTGAMGQPYFEFMLGEHSVGGMLEIQKEWGEVPPNWGIYFAVEDLDATLEMAKSLGGKSEMPPMEIENVGRFAMLTDPQGAYFAVIQMCMEMS